MELMNNIKGYLSGQVGLDKLGAMYGGQKVGMGETPKAVPQFSPVEQPNPNNFDLASKAKGYVAPGPSSPAEMTNPYDVNLDAAAGVDWKNLGMGAAAGIAGALGNRPEAPAPMPLPSVRGGSQFELPKGNLSTMRNMAAPKGILANHQL